MDAWVLTSAQDVMHAFAYRTSVYHLIQRTCLIERLKSLLKCWLWGVVQLRNESATQIFLDLSPHSYPISCRPPISISKQNNNRSQGGKEVGMEEGGITNHLKVCSCMDPHAISRFSSGLFVFPVFSVYFSSSIIRLHLWCTLVLKNKIRIS